MASVLFLVLTTRGYQRSGAETMSETSMLFNLGSKVVWRVFLIGLNPFVLVVLLVLGVHNSWVSTLGRKGNE